MDVLLQASQSERVPPRPAPTRAYTWGEFSPNARLVYTRNIAQANYELSQLSKAPLGFDLEWKPNFVQGEQENRVALVQLANDQVILLLQITAMRELPSKLVEVLEAPEIIKAGVGIQGDTLKLFNDWGVSVRSAVDLSLLARSVDNARWKGKYNAPIGLARLVEIYHYRLLEKGKIRRTNWEKILTPQEQAYAANDAHSGFMIYQHLMGLADPNNLPEARYYTFDAWRGSFLQPSGKAWTPSNPNYDPGPPPPPRVPKAKPDKTDIRDGTGPSQDPDAAALNALPQVAETQAHFQEASSSQSGSAQTSTDQRQGLLIKLKTATHRRSNSRPQQEHMANLSSMASDVSHNNKNAPWTTAGDDLSHSQPGNRVPALPQSTSSSSGWGIDPSQDRFSPPHASQHFNRPPKPNRQNHHPNQAQAQAGPSNYRGRGGRPHGMQYNRDANNQPRNVMTTTPFHANPPPHSHRGHHRGRRPNRGHQPQRDASTAATASNENPPLNDETANARGPSNPSQPIQAPSPSSASRTHRGGHQRRSRGKPQSQESKQGGAQQASSSALGPSAAASSSVMVPPQQA